MNRNYEGVEHHHHPHNNHYLHLSTRYSSCGKVLPQHPHSDSPRCSNPFRNSVPACQVVRGGAEAATAGYITNPLMSSLLHSQFLHVPFMGKLCGYWNCLLNQNPIIISHCFNHPNKMYSYSSSSRMLLVVMKWPATIIIKGLHFGCSAAKDYTSLRRAEIYYTKYNNQRRRLEKVLLGRYPELFTANH